MGQLYNNIHISHRTHVICRDGVMCVTVTFCILCFLWHPRTCQAHRSRIWMMIALVHTSPWRSRCTQWRRLATDIYQCRRTHTACDRAHIHLYRMARYGYAFTIVNKYMGGGGRKEVLACQKPGKHGLHSALPASG